MMTLKKYPPAYLTFIALVLFGFAAPFIYRTVTFYNHLSEYNYQVLPSNLDIGDQVKTIIEIKKDYNVQVNRDRRWAYGMWGYHKITDKVVTYEAPATIEIQDEEGTSLLLQTSNEKTFKLILDSRRSSEITDSLILYIFEEKNGYYHCYEVVRDTAGASKKGKKIDTAITHQFSLDKQSDGIYKENCHLHTMDYEERLKKMAPAILYNHQKKTKGLLVFGIFEVTNTDPLTVKCISHISNQHASELKSMEWHKWFSGNGLLLWIVFTIYFCISLFFISKIISRIVAGRPLYN